MKTFDICENKRGQSLPLTIFTKPKVTSFNMITYFLICEFFRLTLQNSASNQCPEF